MKKNTLATTKTLMLSTALMCAEALAQSGGVAGGTTLLTSARGWLMILVPIICIILGIILAAMYALTDMIRKESLYKYGMGLLMVTIVSPLVGVAFANAS